MDAVKARAEIERARAERIVDPPGMKRDKPG